MQHVTELATVTAAVLNLAAALARLTADTLAHRRKRHADGAPEQPEES